MFVTGSGTGVGKTLVTAALGFQVRQLGEPVSLLKPVLTGYPPQDGEEAADCDVLLRAGGVTIDDQARDAVSPWRYEQPLSPDMAAALQDEIVPFDRLCEFCEPTAGDTVQIIEGIGGVMVPLDAQHTVLDWIARIDIPTVFVVGSYLGTLSHTLTGIAVLEDKKIPVLGIVVCESVDNPVALATTCKTLGNFCSAPILAIPRLAGPDPWRVAPELTGLLS